MTSNQPADDPLLAAYITEAETQREAAVTATTVAAIAARDHLALVNMLTEQRHAVAKQLDQAERDLAVASPATAPQWAARHAAAQRALRHIDDLLDQARQTRRDQIQLVGDQVRRAIEAQRRAVAAGARAFPTGHTYRVYVGSRGGPATSAHPSLGDAVAELLARLGPLPGHVCGVIEATPDSPVHQPGRVTLYRRGGRSVHALGDPELLGHLATLFPIAGWTLYGLPPDPVPIAAARNRLSVRNYNLLSRAGFRYIEDVAAVPDAALLALAGVGSGTLAAIRAATTRGLPLGDTPLTLAPQQVRRLEHLLGALAGYADRAGDDQIHQQAIRFADELHAAAGPAGAQDGQSP